MLSLLRSDRQPRLVVTRSSGSSWRLRRAETASLMDGVRYLARLRLLARTMCCKRHRIGFFPGWYCFSRSDQFSVVTNPLLTRVPGGTRQHYPFYQPPCRSRFPRISIPSPNSRSPPKDPQNMRILPTKFSRETGTLELVFGRIGFLRREYVQLRMSQRPQCACHYLRNQFNSKEPSLVPCCTCIIG